MGVADGGCVVGFEHEANAIAASATRAAFTGRA
jgi:hypothetical protein